MKKEEEWSCHSTTPPLFLVNSNAMLQGQTVSSGM
jgi:hypothetical protein